MAKEAGEIVRYEPAPEPMAGAVAIALLTVFNLLFLLLFVAYLFGPDDFGAPWLQALNPVGTLTHGKELDPVLNAHWNAAGQQFAAFALASVLTTTACILIIYRRWFLPDMLVVKKRRNKFEDL